MINLTTHKDTARVLRNAVLDDISPAQSGTEYIYWQGETDLEPTGKRKQVFDEARKLYELNRVFLYQRMIREGEYQYIAMVV